MTLRSRSLSIVAFCASTLLFPLLVLAQGTQADYDRAVGLREKYVNAGVNLAERATWIGKTCAP